MMVARALQVENEAYSLMERTRKDHIQIQSRHPQSPNSSNSSQQFAKEVTQSPNSSNSSQKLGEEVPTLNMERLSLLLSDEGSGASINQQPRKYLSMSQSFKSSPVTPVPVVVSSSPPSPTASPTQSNLPKRQLEMLHPDIQIKMAMEASLRDVEETKRIIEAEEAELEHAIALSLVLEDQKKLLGSINEEEELKLLHKVVSEIDWTTNQPSQQQQQQPYLEQYPTFDELMAKQDTQSQQNHEENINLQQQQQQQIQLQQQQQLEERKNKQLQEKQQQINQQKKSQLEEEKQQIEQQKIQQIEQQKQQIQIQQQQQQIDQQKKKQEEEQQHQQKIQLEEEKKQPQPQQPQPQLQPQPQPQQPQPQPQPQQPQPQPQPQQPQPTTESDSEDSEDEQISGIYLYHPFSLFVFFFFLRFDNLRNVI